MLVKKVDSGSKTPPYIVCLDIVVLACILVVAGRDDGLAITVSAVIIATAAVVYRCSVGVKSYVSDKARKTEAALQKAKPETRPAPRREPTDSAEDARAKRNSWLRDNG